MHSLAGKRAFVTGGTSGIGLIVAKNYVDLGATVFITGRRSAGGDVAKSIGAQFIQGDMSDETAVSKSLEQATQEAPLDVLVVNAGVADDEGSIEEYASDKAQATIAINLLGSFFALKHAPSKMNDNGAIICTGSIAGSGITHAGAGVYAASKAGVAYLARTSAIELAPRGIRVNCVCPAVIAGTGMMVEDDGGPDAQFMGSMTAFGRMGRQEEVLGAYNFLASDASSFITGQELRVDGGTTAGIGLPMFGALSGE